ncbi:UspA domain-containing protein [Thermodesulfobacterium geofontis OPF15]|jgi:nucleotide-binding universal stress UspA family protein|uniref:UspA domain-containing protein n=1 Tax=Thermodesulfobacterium geofontis (strain OPF15) TaxID=795359 RepID=F8C430_THEGP|nr:universal stress protein [Thermodesulfobacterium geofontis]AEH22570.1 UspA domain-containing protein [Thermodesulfobacterium geofontis OPF15]
MKVFQLYEKMLVACGSEPSGLHALKEIIKYIKEDGKPIIVLSVVPFYEEFYEGDLYLFTSKEDILEKFYKPFKEALEKAKEIGDQEKVIVKTVLEEGDPFIKIVDTALSENCDLIVLGRKKELGLMGKLLGANVARTIGQSPIDILVIPEGSNLSFNKILVPIDGSIYSEIALKKACKIAQTFSSELFILSVVDIPVEISAEYPDLRERVYSKAKNILEGAQKLAENLCKKVETDIREGDPAEKILSFIKEKGIETVVIGSHGKTGMKRLLMGSVAEKVLTFASIPVLVSKSLEFRAI